MWFCGAAFRCHSQDLTSLRQLFPFAFAVLPALGGLLHAQHMGAAVFDGAPTAIGKHLT